MKNLQRRCIVLGCLLASACSRNGRSTSPATPAGPGEEPWAGTPTSSGAAGPRANGRTVLLDPGAEQPRAISEAIATLTPTRGSQVTGTVRFRTEGDAIEVTANVEGLTEGKHAYHVHVYGDCSAPDGTSAGPHFHFHGSSLNPKEKIITGNLGELSGGQAGAEVHHDRIKGASLHGPYSIIGRSVVVHAKGNDPTITPDGGAGARIACGVIGIANPTEDSAAPVSAAPVSAAPHR